MNNSCAVIASTNNKRDIPHRFRPYRLIRAFAPMQPDSGYRLQFRLGKEKIRILGVSINAYAKNNEELPAFAWDVIKCATVLGWRIALFLYIT